MRFKPARRLHGRFFTLLVGPVSEKGMKYACVVSKKVATGAVVRNSIKRRCRAALHGESASIQKPHTFVLYAKSSAAKASFTEIQSDVAALFTAARNVVELLVVP